jgi:hypothetical protein
MGGKGSGRPRTRRWWGDCPGLDVMRVANRFAHEECGEDVFMTSKGFRDCWVAVRGLGRDEYLVEYEWSGIRGVPRRQALLALPAYPNFGGVRWWWSCGGLKTPRWEHDRHADPCGRRVRTLYLRKGRWACRRCWGLAYESEWKEEGARSQETGVRRRKMGVGSKKRVAHDAEREEFIRMLSEFFSV